MHKLAKSNRKIPKRKNIRSKIIKKKSHAFLDITKSSEIIGLVTLSHKIASMNPEGESEIMVQLYL